MHTLHVPWRPGRGSWAGPGGGGGRSCVLWGGEGRGVGVRGREGATCVCVDAFLGIYNTVHNCSSRRQPPPPPPPPQHAKHAFASIHPSLPPSLHLSSIHPPTHRSDANAQGGWARWKKATSTPPPVSAPASVPVVVTRALSARPGALSMRRAGKLASAASAAVG